MRKIKRTSIAVSIILASVFCLLITTTNTFAEESTEKLVARIMRDKVGSLKTGAKISVTATKITDPLNSSFELYRVQYKNDGRPMGGMTVSVMDHEGKKYLFSGGAIWDMNEKIEMQALWRSLTDKAEIPYSDDRLIAGKSDGCTIPISVFSDYQCFHCKRLIPDLIKYVNETDKMCLYHYDMPLTKMHKTAKYMARMVIAYQKLSGENVPQLIYTQKFDNSEDSINEFFEELIKGKGLPVKDFYKMATSTEVTERIDADIQLAQSLGLRGTPSVFVSGHTVTAASVASIKQLMPYLKDKITASNKNR